MVIVTAAVFPALSDAVTAILFLPSIRFIPSTVNVFLATVALMPFTLTEAVLSSMVPVKVIVFVVTLLPSAGEVMVIAGGVLSRIMVALYVYDQFPVLSENFA